MGQPFDTVKVRLQTQSAGNKLYNGVLDCIRKTWVNEGPTAFYKGNFFFLRIGLILEKRNRFPPGWYRSLRIDPIRSR